MTRGSPGEGAPDYRDLVRQALDEDRGRGDATSAAVINKGQRARGVILAKSGLVVAGLDVAAETFRQLDPAVVIEVLWADGSHVTANEPIAFVTGDANALLTAERTALNFLQRLSGIATHTRRHADAVAGTGCKILDTRKTTPGLRMLEKYAVTVGGCKNHRFGLDDGVLIKDNHIAVCGGVGAAVRQARSRASALLRIEVECTNLAEVQEALDARADIILLDNMTTPQMAEAVRLVNGRALLEASGNMSVERVREVAETGVDFISVGALTHSAPAVDLSMAVNL